MPAGLPAGSAQPKAEHGVVRLECHDIPAFETEDYMPPQGQLKQRVLFTYSSESFESDPDKFWKQYGKKENEAVESFIGKSKPMQQAVGEIVAAGDTPEVKARKIYARAQKLRNTSYERENTAQENKRQKEIKNVEDIWREQRGDGTTITWLYLALARAAGLEASPVMVSTRSEYFFNPGIMDASTLNANVVLLKLGWARMFIAIPVQSLPLLACCPGRKPECAAARLIKDGGTWITTTLPDASESLLNRVSKIECAGRWFAGRPCYGDLNGPGGALLAHRAAGKR